MPIKHFCLQGQEIMKTSISKETYFMNGILPDPKKEKKRRGFQRDRQGPGKRKQSAELGGAAPG